jgi:hypothetical protein
MCQNQRKWRKGPILNGVDRGKQNFGIYKPVNFPEAFDNLYASSPGHKLLLQNRSEKGAGFQ